MDFSLTTNGLPFDDAALTSGKALMLQSEFGAMAASPCDCPLPPAYEFPPPPDPSLVFAEFLEEDDQMRREFEAVMNQCAADVPNFVPVEIIPHRFEPIREYLAFIIS